MPQEMIVRLSTSSSNDRLPKGNWAMVWLGVLVTFLAMILYFEWHLRSLGWSPSVVDSADLWVEQRKRASKLGNKALILVGASRMQLDMDMVTLREKTSLEPIQLAIDGTSYIPVLEDLAEDPRVTGTIFVSVNAYNMRKGKPKDTSVQWVNYYKQTQGHNIEPYRVVNNKIATLFNNSLVTRLEGAKPYTIISQLAFQKPSDGNYLTTNPDRSRDADYKKVDMPSFYASRLQRHFGESLVNQRVTFDQFFSIYKEVISKTKVVNNKISFTDNLKYLISLVNKIEARGGKVVLIRFPTGKLVWEIDNKRYPKDLFWHEIQEQHEKSINFSDYSALNKLVTPDGSHLDYRDKKEFTKSLVNIYKKIKSVLLVDQVDARFRG